MTNIPSLTHALSLMVMALGLVHCGSGAADRAKSQNSETQFDSAKLVAMDATIDAGYLEMRAAITDPVEQETLIRKQLKYTVGQINDHRGAPHLESIAIAITGVEPGVAVDTIKVNYSAKFVTSWPRSTTLPESLTLYLPTGNEQAFIDQFMNDQDGGKRCMDWGSHGVDTGTAFYYYRPMKTSCEIKSGVFANVAVVEASLVKSEENTEGKSPEYKKVWEDGRLVVTLVFGKNEGDSMDLNDAGISAYRGAYESLVKAYGQPLSSNLPADLKAPSADQKFALLTFNTPSGVLDVDLELISHVGGDDTRDFEKRYADRMAIADFVSYSGHSGHGANIDQLMKMGTFSKGQYQIFRLNGCDSYAYFTSELDAAHAAVNPGEKGTKYLDLITNSQPSRFSTGGWEAMVIMDALVGKTLTYRQILAKMDNAQQNSVTGEEDNE